MSGKLPFLGAFAGLNFAPTMDRHGHRRQSKEENKDDGKLSTGSWCDTLLTTSLLLPNVIPTPQENKFPGRVEEVSASELYLNRIQA